MKQISFIVGPLEHESNQQIYNKNYGVQRLIGALVDNGMNVSDIAAYEFSSENIQKSISEAEQLLDKMVDLIEPSKVFGFSSYSFNHTPNLILAHKLRQKYPDSKMLFGGPAITEIGTDVMQISSDVVDYLIRGMAEESIVKLMKSLDQQNKSNVPNLVWKASPEMIIENELKYPPENWESVMPYDFDWVTLGYNFNYGHYRVLASMGCIHKCDFCSVVEKEPTLQRRGLDKVIEEIQTYIELAERHGIKKTSIQILDQNYIGQLPKLMVALDSASLTDRISRLSVISRADSLIAGSNPGKLEKALQQYRNIGFTLFVGIESYSDKILQELGKGTTAKQNIQATKLMVDLAEKYKNFLYAIPLIGITPETTHEDLLMNIRALTKCFENSSNPRLPYLGGSLVYGVPMARKLSIERPLGRYLPRIATDGFIANEAEPKDKKTRDILREYGEYKSRIPPQDERMNVLRHATILGIDLFETAFNGSMSEDQKELYKTVYRCIEVNLLYAAIMGDNKPYLKKRVEESIEVVNRLHGPLKNITLRVSKERGTKLVCSEMF